jgi:hypothetical protein
LHGQPFEEQLDAAFIARSALVLAGDARYRWKHGIAAQTTDEWNGTTIPRGRRISLTFRNVK